jgi:hypothetical protein
MFQSRYHKTRSHSTNRLAYWQEDHFNLMDTKWTQHLNYTHNTMLCCIMPAAITG